MKKLKKSKTYGGYDEDEKDKQNETVKFELFNKFRVNQMKLKKMKKR